MTIKTRYLALCRTQQSAVLSTALAGFLLLAIGGLSSPAATADQASLASANDAFFPETYYLRNPFRADTDGDKTIRFDGSYGMDNDDLTRAVADMQDTSMSTSHRLLNHQWLSTYEGNDNSRHGGKAIGQIFLTGLKTFWDNRYGDKLYKGTLLKDKQGNYYQEMDYRIRLSDDSVKMSLEYSF